MPTQKLTILYNQFKNHINKKKIIKLVKWFINLINKFKIKSIMRKISAFGYPNSNNSNSCKLSNSNIYE